MADTAVHQQPPGEEEGHRGPMSYRLCLPCCPPPERIPCWRVAHQTVPGAEGPGVLPARSRHRLGVSQAKKRDPDTGWGWT